MQNRHIIDAAFRQAGVTPRIVVETDSIFALYSHVRHGGLACVMPHSFLVHFTGKPEVTAIPITPLLSRQIGLLTLSREPPSSLVRAFKSLVQELDLQGEIDRLIDADY